MKMLRSIKIIIITAFVLLNTLGLSQTFADNNMEITRIVTIKFRISFNILLSEQFHLPRPVIFHTLGLFECAVWGRHFHGGVV